MEDRIRPRRDLRGLWLLPILALGLAAFVVPWKKPAPPPTESMVTDRAKNEAYSRAGYLLIGRVSRELPAGYTLTSYAPYSSALVTRLGPTRFRCSSTLIMRSQDGQVRGERWQCVVSGAYNSWTCESFQHTPPARIRPVGGGHGPTP